jgi:hypothetical protein
MLNYKTHIYFEFISTFVFHYSEIPFISFMTLFVNYRYPDNNLYSL